MTTTRFRYGRPAVTGGFGVNSTSPRWRRVLDPTEDDDDDNDSRDVSHCQTGDLGWTLRTRPTTTATVARTRRDEDDDNDSVLDVNDLWTEGWDGRQLD